MIRQSILGASAAIAAGLLFVNIYNSLVDAPNWGVNLPNSISVARDYYTAANPGNFFRVFSPLNQLLALTALILSWKNFRYVAMTSLAFALLGDVITFGYFYPRNEVMFMAPIDNSAVHAAWDEWSTMNWFRSFICLLNTILAFTLFFLTAKKSA